MKGVFREPRVLWDTLARVGGGGGGDWKPRRRRREGAGWRHWGPGGVARAPVGTAAALPGGSARLPHKEGVTKLWDSGDARLRSLVRGLESAVRRGRGHAPGPREARDSPATALRRAPVAVKDTVVDAWKLCVSAGRAPGPVLGWEDAREATRPRQSAEAPPPDLCAPGLGSSEPWPWFAQPRCSRSPHC